MDKSPSKYIFGIVLHNPVTNDKALDYKKRIQMVRFGKYSAIVADTENTDYRNASREFLAHLLVGHQQVLEYLMAIGYTIIPMKLGTVVNNDDEVRTVMKQGGALFDSIMKKIIGKVEIDLLATWNDFPGLLKKIGEEPEIAEFKRNLLAKSDQITENDRKQAGLMVQQALNRKREHYAQIISDRLKSAGQAVKPHEALNDEIVFNTSFLIDQKKQKYFDDQVRAVNDELKDELNFRVVGPLPCYSFYTLEVEHLDFDRLTQARKVLGLSTSATWDEIKSAYKNTARDTHPDRQPESAADSGQFDIVKQAFKTVSAYCNASNSHPSSPVYYSFNRQDVDDNQVIVRLRG
ncbi:MAG: GvpL/GvpF family gas vesicle protein [Victivallaceae bacterium]|nr:GvpL/GvpF family gas vesicle protein [Victivallaceae bacterium]